MLWIKPFLAFLTAAQLHTHKERKDYLNISYSILRNRSPYHLLETLNKSLFWHTQEKVTTDKEWKENHKIQDKVQVISNFIFNTVLTMAAVDFANKQKERRWYISYWEGIRTFKKQKQNNNNNKKIQTKKPTLFYWKIGRVTE